MKDVDYIKAAEDSINRIKKGAFLTVKAGDDLNTMTIGWATFGVIWNKPIMMVAVRLSRHTFGMIDKSPDFTVSIPGENLHQELAFCGTKSGRDVNKFKECKLEIISGRMVKSPVIKTKGRHYECKIVYKSAMDPAFLDKAFDSHLFILKKIIIPFILVKYWPVTKQTNTPGFLGKRC